MRVAPEMFELLYWIVRSWPENVLMEFLNNRIPTVRCNMYILRMMIQKGSLLSSSERERAKRVYMNSVVIDRLWDKYAADHKVRRKDIEIDGPAKDLACGLLIIALDYLPNIDAYMYFWNMIITVLHLAVYLRLSQLLQYVLSRQANINERHRDTTETALHIAILESHGEMAQTLILWGADLEVRDVLGETPIFKAVRLQDYEMVEFLLENNARLDATNSKNDTLLHCLMTEKHINIKLLKLLVGLGLHCNYAGEDNCSPLHVLARNPDLVNKVAIAEILVTSTTNLNSQSNSGLTVLHEAATIPTESNMLFIEFLIRKGSDTSIMNLNSNFLDIMVNNNPIQAMQIMKFLLVEEAINNFHFNAVIQSTISNHFLNIQECGRRELEVLNKKIPNANNFSLLTLYLSSKNKLKKLCRNEDIRKILMGFNEENFPIFGEDISKKFQKRLECYEAEYSCYLYFLNATEGELNWLVLEKVYDYCSDDCLIELKKKLSW